MIHDYDPGARRPSPPTIDPKPVTEIDQDLKKNFFNT